MVKSKVVSSLDEAFRTLLDNFSKLQAELNSINSWGEKAYRDLLEESNYARLQRLIAMMYHTSEAQSKTFSQIHRICLELLRGAQSSDNAVDEIKIKEMIAKIKQVEKQGLAYAQKLPLSFDDGWRPRGDVSIFRQILNLPGYLLEAPYLYARGERGTLFKKSLLDLQKVVEEARKMIATSKASTSPNPRLDKAKQELEQAMKDFDIFVRLTTQLHRKFKRLHEECMKVCKDFKTTFVVTGKLVRSEAAVEEEWVAV